MLTLKNIYHLSNRAAEGLCIRCLEYHTFGNTAIQKQNVSNEMRLTLHCKYGRAAWKNASGYHGRSLAETAMFRYKTLFGSQLSEAQTSRALIRCAALKLMTRFWACRKATKSHDRLFFRVALCLFNAYQSIDSPTPNRLLLCSSAFLKGLIVLIKSTHFLYQSGECP
jgi:hypothetical protein